ncbi:hypothetical protein A3C87_01260 [Candidatus Kaiserbacteria bacterium RIFCSPHIGHO2_02_FULL_49_34]|uniref:HTTM domain-containing protein n=1 Tax=Candidatus Kaiserbacteria bacterium RIFCSPHIGHO2_02_FULL_49_34 TaxID=1798491 RepID=A0A1F6DL85_9BACT|nr:MAG: hypothetical protein A3C87_01260 [Candidatus Kaiserbacteria bacterium RIFCSPHIGHO2_02_FULL_49_34]
MFSKEIAQNKILQWAFGSLLLSYYITFSGYFYSGTMTQSAYDSFRTVCRPWFQSCEQWILLEQLPYGYSQPTLYMLFFGLMLWVVYLIYKKEWREAQLSLIPLFAWHFFTTFFGTDLLLGNYDYYIIIFAIVLLFLPHKEFFLKLGLVLFYVLSTVSKISPAWIEGGYFTAMYTGLPFFPDWSIPLFTNLVIVAEMVLAWFLLSPNKFLQRTALVFFAAFHFYSSILVGYHYPTIVFAMILVMFGPWYRYTAPPFDTKSLPGWGLIILLILAQLSPKFIEGDEKLTMEGNKNGLYMFEANHQCISQAVVYGKNGETENIDMVSESARRRCDPYRDWFRLTRLCAAMSDINRISFTFDHSLNGGPFYRIVDTNNICALTYKAIGHNDWIHTENEAEIVGYPVKNHYR